MPRIARNPSAILSSLIVVLAAIASAGGLLLDGLYRDNRFVTSAWKGNDLVTLFVAVPILAAAMILSARGSTRARLVWLGTLDYMLYNYAFYLFAARFNSFFLIYAALFGLSIFALIYGLATLDTASIAARAGLRMPVRLIAGYMLFVAVGLTLVYLGQSFAFAFTGKIPDIVTLSGHPTSIVFALDLTLLVPFLALGGLWLPRRKPWGFVLAGMLTVKGPLYTTVLTAGSLWAANSGIDGVAGQIPLWVGLTAMGSIACVAFFANIPRSPGEETPR